MKELLRKKFELVVDDKILEYEQLSYYDCLEFDFLIKENDYQVTDRCKAFFESNGITKIDKIDIKKFFDTYCDTALRWFYAKGSNNKKTYQPWWSFVVFLTKELQIDPIRLLKEYTPEAINFLMDWIEWNLNAQTKEWQNRNERKAQAMQLKEWDKDEELESIKRKQLLRAKKRDLSNNQG